jgi:filamentous hemagglutinin family protein
MSAVQAQQDTGSAPVETAFKLPSINTGTITCLGFLAICPIFGALSRIALAQQHNVSIDARFSPTQMEMALTGPKYAIPATFGKQMGGNLFHSFGKFSLESSPVQESATFTSDGSTGKISNVIGRVTGGTVSSIDGLIRSTITGANLYLINPNGIVFGPNAKLDVSGSFHASTADYIKMSDGAQFQATNPGGSTLSAKPPAAFGFLNATPGRITVNGSTLGVPSGRTLGLVGGPPTSVTGATLSAPAGTIRVTSVAGPGEVPAAKGTGSKPTVTGYGSVDITKSSKLDVNNARDSASGGSVFIRAGALKVDGESVISGDNRSAINGDNYRSNAEGRLVLHADGNITISDGATVHADNFGSSAGGRLVLKADGNITISRATVHADVVGTGTGAAISVKAGSLSISSAAIGSQAIGKGGSGDISVNVAGVFSIDGGPNVGILTQSGSTGNPGKITISAARLSLSNSAEISSSTSGPAKSGSVFVNTGILNLENSSKISSNSSYVSNTTDGLGTAGDVTIKAMTASIRDVSEINSGTSGDGNAGTVRVSVSGNLSIVGPSLNDTFISDNNYTGIGTVANPGSHGKAGSVFVNAGSLSIARFLGEISSSTLGSGNAGDVSVNVDGLLSIAGPRGNFPTGIVAAAFREGTGNAGNVAVKAGSLSIVNQGEISAASAGAGAGGGVTVITPGPLLLDGMGANGTQIAASATATQSGQGGSVTVDAGTLTVKGGARIASTTAGRGNGGTVQVVAQGPLTLTDRGTDITATSTASGNAGSVMVGAPQITIAGGGEISSTTAGLGNGGSVMVTTPGALVLDGMGVGGTRIAASADQGSLGRAGEVIVAAGNLAVQGGAQIASSTAGPGKGGDVSVMVANAVALSGVGSAGASGITTSAELGSSGDAGQVVLKAGGAIALSGGAEVASSTAGGGVGGSVNVTTPGALVLDGVGVGGTRIAASADQGSLGRAGDVTVAAGNLTVQGGAQIASSTAGPGKGGNVSVTVTSDIVLPDPGPQISARSTGSGDAGSVTVSAARLLMNNGAAISTEAEQSTANARNITLDVRDLLYLVSSTITTSVSNKTGSGGNITIDPQFLILNHSSIIAEAIEGNGGNITINASQYIPSADSIVSASSQLGISGNVVINGPLVDVNGALVVLSSELRSAAQVLRTSCAAQATRPQSTLVEGGRGGLPQDPDTTLPALYFADRDLNLNSKTGGGASGTKSAQQTRVHLTMHCG